ncbi:hypothetical protein ACFL5Z_20835 [Planctomycetota bacterium]
MGQDGLHNRFHRLGGLGNLDFERDDHFLDLAPLNLALQGDLQTDGLDGLRIRLIRKSLGDNLVQNGNGRLRQPLFDGVVHLLPQAFPRSRSRQIRSHQHENQDA